MDLVAVDWFKDVKRMDHVSRRQGCAAQVRLIETVINFFVWVRRGGGGGGGGGAGEGGGGGGGSERETAFS